MAVGDLCSLNQVKQLCRLTTDDSFDVLLSNLITMASRRIETDCSRVFTAANYVEFQNCGRGQQRAQVRNKPLIKLNSVRWGYQTAVQVSYSGTDISATMTVAGTPSGPDRVVLNNMNTSGVSSVNTFNLTTSSYQTASQVAAGIGAVSGYAATLLGGINVPAKWFIPQTWTIKTGNANYTQGIGYPWIDGFGYVIDETYGTFGFAPFSSMDYFFPQDGRTYAPYGFPGMFQGLCIDYRGGYETIPSDINLVTMQVVKNVYDETAHDGSVNSESLGDYAYTMIDPMLRRQVYADMLAPYKRIPIAGGMG